MALTSDPHEDFAEMPDVARSALAPLGFPGVFGPELSAPLTNGLIGNDGSTFGEPFLDVAETQSKSMVQPNPVTDDFLRESVAVIGARSWSHPWSLTETGSS